MAERKNKGILDRIWDTLASVKLAIVIFALISLTSIVGTVIEQNAAPETNIDILGRLLGAGLAPGVYSVLDAMGFTDMYHSWWFTALLMFFASNLMICSLARFPRIWRLVHEPLKPLGDEQFGGFPIKRDFTLNDAPEGGIKKLTGAFRSMGFSPIEAEEGGLRQLYAQKGRYSRLGVYITHTSVIVILIGAVIGVSFGFSGFIDLPEGATYPIAFGRNAISPAEHVERGLILEALEKTGGDVPRAALLLDVNEPRLRTRMKAVGLEHLGFEVRCDDFDVAFYGTTNTPKEYTSRLTILEGGREVLSKWIEVNSPLKYGGYTFYQSSYGMMDDPSQYIFKMRVASPSGSDDVSVRQGEEFTLPGTDIRAYVAEFSPALSFKPGGRPFTYAGMMNNPAVKLTLNNGGKEYSMWVLKRYPETWKLDGSRVVELQDVWGAQFTGLQVRRDPGVRLVYLGCIIMSAGLYIAFFMSHRRIWARVAPEKGLTRVTVAASSHKNREAFERKLDRAISLLTGGGI